MYELLIGTPEVPGSSAHRGAAFASTRRRRTASRRIATCRQSAVRNAPWSPLSEHRTAIKTVPRIIAKRALDDAGTFFTQRDASIRIGRGAEPGGASASREAGTSRHQLLHPDPGNSRCTGVEAAPWTPYPRATCGRQQFVSEVDVTDESMHSQGLSFRGAKNVGKGLCKYLLCIGKLERAVRTVAPITRGLRHQRRGCVGLRTFVRTVAPITRGLRRNLPNAW